MPLYIGCGGRPEHLSPPADRLLTFNATTGLKQLHRFFGLALQQGISPGADADYLAVRSLVEGP